MARETSPDIDDELFNEVYGKEYTGPPRPTFGSIAVKAQNKRSSVELQSDEDDGPRDPNAVPTDFTSREAKVWEAKAKATERNWKKRKEEEMICKICGESGHFTQGCPSTLGANRKSADFFERVPARDKNVRALFSEKVISQIEKDVGCKIRMDEKFLFVSGRDRLILAKGVDAVHKVIQEGDKDKRKGSASSHRSRSKSPDGNSGGPYLRHAESLRSYNSPRDTSGFQSRNFNHDRIVEDPIRQDQQKFKGSPHAYTNEGGKGQPARSKSPPRPGFGGGSFGSYDDHNRNSGMHAADNWGIERQGAEFHSERKFDYPVYPQTLEELEMEFKREAMEFGRVRDKEEDEENNKHRECMRELKESYMKKLGIMRGMHAKQWEEFLQRDSQRRQQGRHNAYNQPSYSEHDQSVRNVPYMGANLPVDSRKRYPYPGDNYSASRSHDAYHDFHHQRHGDYAKDYGRY
ncbi:Zinc finger CCHC-type protein [Dioscorea alata]|uniref:Zinc finger CCHC-type protein n=4 Tax=Dioscorea alata TaxID=55571 RepID=A0ACB7U4G3_DIOAL|nr:Zinc finger CCHC-type protein [Dioscorea alata]KAH7655128.1 Zinc finger CCHC-type protein [Dioscorea alata]KAH7655132.1 Zinc finger CCHC-type protein [Dioscorea alata]KAH7655133.1 Zinc finger CCHC-type protein [Dioscorea alata]